MATPAPAATTASAPAAAESTPAVAESTPATASVTTTTNLSSGTATAMAGVGIVSWVIGAFFLLLFHLGAAKLSYDVHQSALWGFLSFLFASVYYPYYAFVYSTRRESSFFGGRKSRK